MDHAKTPLPKGPRKRATADGAPPEASQAAAEGIKVIEAITMGGSLQLPHRL